MNQVAGAVGDALPGGAARLVYGIVTQASPLKVRVGTAATAVPATAVHGQSPAVGAYVAVLQQGRDRLVLGPADTAGATPPLAGRNLLLNGRGQVNQRGVTSATITGTDVYGPDRWSTTWNNFGAFSHSVQTVTFPDVGVVNTIRYTCTTAAASPAASAYLALEQYIEGRLLRHLRWGTADAAPLTLSFRVKSSVTGTTIVNVQNLGGTTRSISVPVTITAANVWESKVVTIPGDTGQTPTLDSGLGLRVMIWAGAGSDFSSGTLGTSWATSVNANRAVGVTNWAAATGRTIEIGAVQLEVGLTPTPLELVAFDEELRRCQRFFHQFDSVSNGSARLLGTGIVTSTTVANILIPLGVPLRTGPATVTFSGATDFEVWTGSTSAVATTALGSTATGNSIDGARVDATVAGGLTVGQGAIFRIRTSVAGWVRVSAEYG